MPVSISRKIAFDVLQRVEAEGAYASDVLHAKLDTSAELKPADAALATELVMGVLRWRRLLDFLLDRHMKKPVERLALYSSSCSVTSALPFRALSLSRYRLDDALLQCAQNSGARLKRNVAVKSVTPAGTGWNVLCDEGEIIYCRHLVLATGKLGLRGVDDARDGSLVGLKMHLRLSPRSPPRARGPGGTLSP